MSPPPQRTIQGSWAHLAAALRKHSMWCRDNGIRVPADVTALTKYATQQETTTLSASDSPGHDPVVSGDVLVVTYVDAGRRIGVSKRTVERLVAAGALPAVEIGGSPRIRVADLEAYVAGLSRRSFRDTVTDTSKDFAA